MKLLLTLRGRRKFYSKIAKKNTKNKNDDNKEENKNNHARTHNGPFCVYIKKKVTDIFEN